MLPQKFGHPLILITPLFFVVPLLAHGLIFSLWMNQPLLRSPLPLAQEGGQVTVEAPAPNDVLQGQVAIQGSTDLPGFRTAEIDFAYQTDPTHTWFLIQQINTPVKEGPIANWDTTTISDGEYQLRVRVFLKDGQAQESIISGLRVRNYTIIETSTPDAGLTARRTPTPTRTPLPDFAARSADPTPLPTNPAQVTDQDLRTSAWQGGAIVLGIFLAAGVYVGLRLLARR